MKVLVVDDEALVRRLVRDALSDQGYEIQEAASGQEALELAAEHQFDLVFCDVMMDGLSGFDVLKTLRGRMDSQAEIILMTGNASVEAAIKAVQQGASDYICKPLEVKALRAMALAVKQRRYANNIIEVPSARSSQFAIIGNSPAMIDVVKNATRVAATDLPVMVCGPSGSGKELIARLIHQKSARANMPFVAVNCGALPDTLLEAELFGHTRGAFTGASDTRRGLFEEANGGTLFLDEVTETSPAFQVKLLRVLQEGEIRQLGSNARKQVNVRVLSATNQDPKALAESGLFRPDLLYRLQGVEIAIPPLKERPEDIRPMALAFLAQFNTNGRQLAITREALAALERYDWPGNVRELKHMMHRLAALSGGVIRLEDLPQEVVAAPAVASAVDALVPEGDLPTLQEVESNYLLRVLSAVNGNKSRAAQVMGVDRKTLYRMMERQAGATTDKSEGAKARPRSTPETGQKQ
ncbi:MAG TPA: sigma-54 dependent transcriptional regulator [Blastocatellia bacterium]|nr:sigma-54 dependent transcriptional regulator [Blastocatellia bacterium]